MAADTGERLYDIHSKRERATGQMYLKDARLFLGDGSSIEFVEGVAEKVPQSAIDQLGHRSDLVFLPIEGTGPAAEPAPEAAEPAPPPAEPAAAPTPAPEPVPAPAPPQADPEAIAAAREHLEAEGIEVPALDPNVAKAAPADPTVPLIQLPAGFEATTAEGHPRCLAAKGDGEQCKNEAQEGTFACGMEAHKTQVAERATAAAGATP